MIQTHKLSFDVRAGFLSNLFRRRTDPTRGWRSFGVPTPDFDLNTSRFGTLRFGDSIDAAAFLGRPESFEGTERESCQLLYASSGFELEFDIFGRYLGRNTAFQRFRLVMQGF